MTWRDRFLSKHGKDILDINFVPETPSEKLENAKLEVIALLDNPDWAWLAAKINEDCLSWQQIFKLVENHPG